METAPTFFDQLAQWSEIIGGFAFVIVAIILFGKFVLPAVRAGQAASNADLVNAEARLETLKGDVAKARAELESADRDAQAAKARGASDAGRERNRLVAEAESDGQRLVANAQNELARARVAAGAELRADFVGRALQLARERAASQISPAINTRLVGATVETLLGDAGAGAA